MDFFDRRRRAVNERRCDSCDRAQMRDGCEVVIHQKAHRQRIDFVVHVCWPLLQYPRKLANSYGRHISQMYGDRILRAVIRRASVRRLREDAFDLSQPIGCA